MHMHDGRIDHLYLSIVSGSEGIYNLVPDASPAPAYEAIVAGLYGPKLSGRSHHRSPDRKI
jgi:hypothetical protein